MTVVPAGANTEWCSTSVCHIKQIPAPVTDSYQLLPFSAVCAPVLLRISLEMKQTVFPTYTSHDDRRDRALQASLPAVIRVYVIVLLYLCLCAQVYDCTWYT